MDSRDSNSRFVLEEIVFRPEARKSGCYCFGGTNLANHGILFDPIIRVNFSPLNNDTMPRGTKDDKPTKRSKRSLFSNNDDNTESLASTENEEKESAAPAIIDLTGSPPPKKRRPHQHGIEAFTSPVSQRRRPTATVTPEQEESQALSQYIPTYIHKNLEYRRGGSANLSAATLEVFRLITQHYVIPEGFEQSRKYGPLSGTCYEERVIQAYSLGKLTPVEGSEKLVICTVCATEGHRRSSCPTLV